MADTSVIATYHDGSTSQYLHQTGNIKEIIEDELERHSKKVVRIIIHDSEHVLYFLRKL